MVLETKLNPNAVERVHTCESGKRSTKKVPHAHARDKLARVARWFECAVFDEILMYLKRDNLCDNLLQFVNNSYKYITPNC